MATRPSTDPVWASAVGAFKTTPPTVKQETGWELTTPKEKPFLDYMNWWMNLVYQWILYFRSLTSTAYNVTINASAVNAALASLDIDPTVYRAVTIELALYVDATTDVYAVIVFDAVSNGATWGAYGQYGRMTTVPDPGITLNITAAGEVQYSTIAYPGFVSGRASLRVTQLDLA